MEGKITILVFCIAMMNSIDSRNIFTDIIVDIQTAKTNFDNFLSYSDKRKESAAPLGYLLNSLVKVGLKLEKAAFENANIVINENFNDSKAAAVACAKYAQLIGDLESLEPIFKNNKQYTEAINTFMKNKRDLNALFYGPFMAAFHVNSLSSWTKFRGIYLKADLNQIVDSIFQNQEEILQLLSGEDCDKYAIGEYCSFTVSGLFKVLSMRGSARSVQNEDNIDGININLYSVLSSCTKAVNAC